MRQFMRQGEHLRRFGVRAVNEDKRRILISQNETLKLIHVEFTALVLLPTTPLTITRMPTLPRLPQQF